MGGACSSSQPNTKARVIKMIGKAVEPEVMEKRYVRGDNVEAIEEMEVLQAFFDEIADGEKWEAARRKELRNKLWPEPQLEVKMEPTKIPSLDDFFNAAATPMNQVIRMRENLQNAIDDIKRLCRVVSKNKRVVNVRSALVLLMESAAEEFTVVVTLDPPGIDLVISKTCKGDVFEALSALERLAKAVINVAKEAPTLADNIVALVKKCEELPDKVQSEAPSAGLNPLEIAKAAKNVAGNTQKLAKFPNVVNDMIKLARAVLKDLKELAGSR